MSGMRRALAFALSLLLPVARALADAGSPPESLVAEYRVVRQDIQLAQVVVTLEIGEDGGYAYESRTKPTGLIAVFRDSQVLERSEGQWSPDGFVPSHYSYFHHDGDQVRKVRVDFDWASGKAVNRAGGTTWSMPVPPATQDKLGQQLSLMNGLASGVHSLSIPVADGGRLKTYHYEVQGPETLHTATGDLIALKVIRRKDEHPSRLTLWSAPSLGYLPVRIDRREGDQLYRMELTTVRREPSAAQP
jgi:hypothetical protein